MVAGSKKSFVRSRWVMVGAVVAVALGAGGVLTSSAAPSANATSFVPITPCRLMDTRAGGPIGPRNTPIGSTPYVATVRGTNGNCVVPAAATAVSLNVTFASPSANSFVTVYPADKPLPNTSNLNFSAGQAPAPNAVTVALSADGKIAIRNDVGTVVLLVDVVGFYEPAGTASVPVDPCAAFVGTYVSSESDGVDSGMVIQLLAGGGMSAVPEPEVDLQYQSTAQEGRWTCTGAGFTARTLDTYRSAAVGTST